MSKIDEAALETVRKFDVAEYLDDYEFRGDGGDYTPNEGERVLIEDAIEGALGALHDALAALPKPEPVAVKVKPLEWKGDDGGSGATSPFGAWYFVNQSEPGWRIHFGDKVFYSSQDEAKSAAQADYEARILSALVTEPSR